MRSSVSSLLVVSSKLMVPEKVMVVAQAEMWTKIDKVVI